ncbi:MAG: aldo/keto reductase [Rhodopseudomonas palustris]|nr:aldo/keto reductase [Rhodopseudomonas palustris]
MPWVIQNNKNGMKRRDFLKLGVVTATSAAVGLSVGKVLRGSNRAPSITPVYRTLGRTGLKVTIVSFGAMLTPEHEVMEAAFDMGINYVDTARRYMGGRNEEIVGRALKGRREQGLPGNKNRFKLILQKGHVQRCGNKPVKTED